MISFDIEAKPSPMKDASAFDDAPRKGVRWGALIFVIIAILASGGMVFFVFNIMSERDALTEQVSLSATDASPEPSNAASPQSRGTISVNLKNVPARAVWFVDGRQLGANPFKAPRSTVVHKIRVEAQGYSPFETDVSFSEDQEILVEMEALEVTQTPDQIKAYTHGLGANQRPRKQSKNGDAAEPVDRFGSQNAPDNLTSH